MKLKITVEALEERGSYYSDRKTADREVVLQLEPQQVQFVDVAGLSKGMVAETVAEYETVIAERAAAEKSVEAQEA
jgi:hypothetical protein